MKLLEDGVEPLQSSPHASAFIIDALSLLQTLTRVPDRFVDLVDLVSGVKYSHRASGRSNEDRLCGIPKPGYLY